MEGFSPSDTVGSLSPAASYSSSGSAYSSSPARDTATSFWPPSNVSMIPYSNPDLPSASVSTGARRRRGKKGKDVVLSYPRYRRPKKIIRKMACRFCNPIPSSHLKWNTPSEQRAHYREIHDYWAYRSKETTCNSCGNKYDNVERAKSCQENCIFVRDFEVD